MQRIISITDVRNNVSRIVSDVAQTKRKVVIVRDSIPEAVLIPYQEFLTQEQEREKLWQMRFARLLKTGKNTFKKWAAKRKINVDKLTEEEMYEIVEKV